MSHLELEPVSCRIDVSPLSLLQICLALLRKDSVSALSGYVDFDTKLVFHPQAVQAGSRFALVGLVTLLPIKHDDDNLGDYYGNYGLARVVITPSASSPPSTWYPSGREGIAIVDVPFAGSIYQFFKWTSENDPKSYGPLSCRAQYDLTLLEVLGLVACMLEGRDDIKILLSENIGLKNEFTVEGITILESGDVEVSGLFETRIVDGKSVHEPRKARIILRDGAKARLELVS